MTRPNLAAAVPFVVDRAADGIVWEKPQALSRLDRVPPFPVAALPSWFGDMVAAEAESLQVDAAMPAAFGLGALAALCGGKVGILGKRDWYEPTCLYIGVVALPGEMKSPCQAHMTEPVREWERSLIERERGRVEEARARRELLELDCERAKAAYQRAKNPGEREIESHAYASARAALTEAPEVFEPRIIIGDATPESVLQLLAQHGGNLACLADEDSLIGHLSGRYSKNPAIEAFLTAYDARPIVVDRRGRPTLRIERPTLTISVPMQPGLLASAHGNAAIKGRGLLDRFTLLAPPSLIGRRNVDAAPVPFEVRARYREAVFAIAAALDGADVTLTLSPQADACFRTWRRRLERRIAPTGDLASIGGWAGKAAGRCLRIAALIHIAETIGSGLGEPVTVAAMMRAANITDCLAAHAVAAVDLVGGDETLETARAVLRWILDQRSPVVAQRDVHYAFEARLKTAEDARRVMDLLTRHNLVRLLPAATGARGGRPAKRYAVSPMAGEVLSVLSVPTRQDQQALSSSLSSPDSLREVPDRTDRTPQGNGMGVPNA